jgi:Holliday junction resolvase RusA-like endonuclease
MRYKIVQLSVPGEPQGKQRPKATRIGKRAIIYTPKQTVNYETYIKELFAIKYPDFVLVEAVLEIELIAWLMIPTSASRKRKAMMENHELRPGKRPDVDNLIKVVMDALEKLTYKNDAQIVSAKIDKYYSNTPGLDIRIYRIETSSQGVLGTPPPNASSHD